MNRVVRGGSRKIDTISRLRPMRPPISNKNKFLGISSTDVSRWGGGGVEGLKEMSKGCFSGKNQFVSLPLHSVSNLKL